MRNLTKKEAEKITPRTPAVEAFRKMKVGDAVEILKSEWKKKTDPVVLVASSFHRGRSGMRFMSRTEADRWIIKRLS